MHNRRFTRLTNAFSKRVENHAYSIALFTFYDNFVRLHKTLRVSPAMAAGVADKLWEMGDLVRVIEDWEAKREATKKLGADICHTIIILDNIFLDCYIAFVLPT